MIHREASPDDSGDSPTPPSSESESESETESERGRTKKRARGRKRGYSVSPVSGGKSTLPAASGRHPSVSPEPRGDLGASQSGNESDGLEGVTSLSPASESAAGTSKDDPAGAQKRVYEYNDPLEPDAQARLIAELQNCPAVWQKSKDGRHKDSAAVSAFFRHCDAVYFGGKPKATQKWYNTQRRALTQGLGKLKMNSGADAKDPLFNLQPKERWAQETLGFMADDYVPRGTRFGVDWEKVKVDQAKDKKQAAKDKASAKSAKSVKTGSDKEGIKDIKDTISKLQKEVLNNINFY